MRIDLVTIFPELVDLPLRTSIIGRAAEAGVVQFGVHDLREHGLGRHRSVDDYPYGGGAGMVMRPEPLFAALAPLRAAGATVILLDPAGERLTDALARELATVPHLALVAARYEGIDERVRTIVDREVSIGDYVITGGELPALVLIDAVVRLLPGAITDASSADDSFAAGLLEYPQYTRPESFEGLAVPPVLLSGHHGEVAAWRRRESLRRTLERRPDLLESAPLTDADRATLADLASEADGPGGKRPSPPPPSAAIRPPVAAGYSVALPCSRHSESVRRRYAGGKRGRPTMNAIKELEREQLRTDVPEIAPGDTVRVSVKVVEGSRERIQVFEGTVMRMRGGGLNRQITVRRIASGVGVERTFMVHAPRIEKIEVVRHGVARRAQLYFLRNRVGKAATLRERRAN